MKKRILAMLLASLMCLSLAACGGDSAADNGSANDTPADTGADAPAEGDGGSEDGASYKIALLMSHQTNAFTNAVSAGARAKGEELGVEVEVFDGNQDQATQNSQLEQCLNQGYNGILVEPVTVDGIAPAVKEANEQGIPVMTVVQKMTQQDLAVAYRGGNDANAGRLQMEKAVEMLGGKGNIALLYGPMGSDGQLIRKEGYDAVLADNPDVQVVFEETANWVTEEALSLVETWLSTGTEINAIVAQNDSMALGAQKAIEDAGKQDDILVFGVDAVDDAIAAIAAGRLDGTVSQDASGQGALGVETMVSYLNGEEVEPEAFTECIWIDSSNVADYK